MTDDTPNSMPENLDDEDGVRAWVNAGRARRGQEPLPPANPAAALEHFERDRHARIFAWFALANLGPAVEAGIANAEKGPWGPTAARRQLPGDLAAAVAACGVDTAITDKLDAIAVIHEVGAHDTTLAAVDAVMRQQGVLVHHLDAVGLEVLRGNLLYGDHDFGHRCMRASAMKLLGSDLDDAVMSSRAVTLALDEVNTSRPALTVAMVLTVAMPVVWPHRASKAARIAALRELLDGLPARMLQPDDEDGAVDTSDVPDDLSGLEGAP